MWLLEDGALGMLAGLGAALVCSVLLGWLLRLVPGRGLWVTVPGRDNGEYLERDLRALMWLREWGLLRCPVVIADGGLTHEGREVAVRLAERWPEVVLWNDAGPDT